MPNPKKTKSTIMVDSELWKRLRIITVLNDMEISEFVEEALREKLEKIQQPEQYQAYKDVENIRLPAGQQKQQHQPQEQEQQTQSQLSNFLDPSNLEITGSAHNEVHVKLYLPEIQFPTNRDRLLDHAKNIERNKELFILNELPNTNKIYGNKKELEENILKSFTVSKKLVSELKRYKVDKIIGCTVTTTKYKNELLNSEVTYKGRIR